MNKQWLIGALSALMSLSVGAAVDETKVQSRTNAEFQKEISSNFTNLTPDAIAAGLRDLVIIGTVNQGEGNKPDIVWHSISKVVGNEQVAAALSEPLGSPKVTALPKVGEEFDIVGNLDSLLADYLRMMAEAKKNDITLKEEAAEKDSSSSSGGSGTSGGYFDNNQTEKPDTGADDFVVKPDTTTKRTVACSINYDFDKLVASEMAKEETVSSNTNAVVSSTDCQPTGVTYPILKEYAQSKCATTTDFTNAKHYLAYRHYIDKSGTGEKAEYVSECKTDTANPLTILQDTSDCGISENLTSFITTVNKKWYYDDKGAQVFVSDCMPSSETYLITESDADCVPFLNENLGTVYTQSQLVWTDSKSVVHKVTECRPSNNELQLSKEYKGTLEHDFVGGVSYEISRDYYVYKGEKKYVTDFSRDPTISYPHYRSTDGCSTANDDANLRSRLYEKTFITKNGATSVIKDCTASSNYIPYQNLGITSLGSYTYETTCRISHYTLAQMIDMSRTQLNIGDVTVWKQSPSSNQRKQCTWGGGDDKTGEYQSSRYYGTQQSWRRFNGTTYSISTIYAEWN
ncbi:hypothetical protein Q5N48_17385 [Vibrio cholerae]|uniref:hypothetical protein n=1 Tax=Vibrio cholerae TaxID=666 RepID=UPI002934BAF0|nr:hypothetical protein [Vibrio cholerae]MDV2358399.1 hypothetical protein [Vibrio cholerae]